MHQHRSELSRFLFYYLPGELFGCRQRQHLPPLCPVICHLFWLTGHDVSILSLPNSIVPSKSRCRWLMCLHSIPADKTVAREIIKSTHALQSMKWQQARDLLSNQRTPASLLFQEKVSARAAHLPLDLMLFDSLYKLLLKSNQQAPTCNNR